MSNELLIQWKRTSLLHKATNNCLHFQKHTYESSSRKKTLRWTRFHWTKVEKVCSHDEIAICITASKCPSGPLVHSLDLFVFMIDKACSQKYVLANLQV